MAEDLHVSVRKYRPEVGQVSCVGILTKEYPVAFGNYFWLREGPYIVNCWAENLEEWARRNPAVHEICVVVVEHCGRRIGFIRDDRMDGWLNSTLCITGHGWPTALACKKVCDYLDVDATKWLCGCEQDAARPGLGCTWVQDGVWRSRCGHCGNVTVM